MSWVRRSALVSVLLAAAACRPIPAEAPPGPPPRTALTRADCDEHVRRLERKIPAGFTVIVQPPFVVIGNDTPAAVRRSAERTVKWAVDLLKKDYFERDPDRVLSIWLFKDRETYRKYTADLFGEKPTTPFGYYSETHGALIMNIATGGGTLVHEIVHPFMRANFPRCPAWFNEGLASLYEQCGERDGHICGFTNWRLGGLQDAIRARELPTFEQLTATTDAQFYGEGSGLRYAQARYLCYYLQERGLLRRFYREFRDNVADDPAGCQTLSRILDEKDMAAFQTRWEAFVLALRFP